jgi:small subunit ribosomal protein S17
MKTLTGIILTIGKSQTATVDVVTKTPHKLYGKLMKKNKKYKVDTNNVQISVGNQVKIVETRPISKDKHFKIVEILVKNKEVTK